MNRRNLKHLHAGLLGTLILCAAPPGSALAAGQGGVVVVRDAQTGQMRAPTPDELRQLRASRPQGATPQALPGAAHSVLGTRPNGARGVRLGENSLVYEVVTRGPDGRLSNQCVQGEAAARAALRNPDAASRPGAGQQSREHEEHDHEAR